MTSMDQIEIISEAGFSSIFHLFPSSFFLNLLCCTCVYGVLFGDESMAPPLGLCWIGYTLHTISLATYW